MPVTAKDTRRALEGTRAFQRALYRAAKASSPRRFHALYDRSARYLPPVMASAAARTS